DFTPITLWIFGEGRYEPTNFPTFVIDENDLIWHWETHSSNYLELRDQKFKDTNNEGWVVEAAGGFSGMKLTGDLVGLTRSDPVKSGYGDDTGQGAFDECQADLGDLLSNIDPQSLWVTRISADMSKAALASDLDIAAASDQTPIAPVLNVPYGSWTGNPCGSF